VKALPTDRVWMGVACAAAAYGLFAVQSLAAKLLAEGGYHPVELSFWRCALSLAPFAAWIVLRRRWGILRITRPGLLAFRVVIGITNLWFLFAAVALLPMANATTVIMSNVLLTPLLAIVFLGERVGWHRWAAIGAGFGGVVIAAGPAWAMSPAGLACGLACALLMAGVKVSLRGLKDAPPLGTAFYFLAGGTVLSALALPWVGTHLPTAPDAPLFALMGASGLAGQILICIAFARAPTSLIAPWDYTGLIWAAAFDVLLWGLIPGWPVFAGAGVIAAAHLYILHRERRRA
jgi:drug/metabolite transporter (DMT)-like permease